MPGPGGRPLSHTQAAGSPVAVTSTDGDKPAVRSLARTQLKPIQVRRVGPAPWVTGTVRLALSRVTVLLARHPAAGGAGPGSARAGPGRTGPSRARAAGSPGPSARPEAGFCPPQPEPERREPETRLTEPPARRRAGPVKFEGVNAV